MSEIALGNLCKSFGETDAVVDVTFTVREGEFFSLLGPSGSGKSTVLRLIAGFFSPSSGDILIGGVSMVGLPPEKRDIGYVFQDYALFPHLSVFDNVGFGLRARKVDRKTATRRIKQALERAGLGSYEKRRPSELSGGERQRVAIARALVIEPKVLLLDEPLGALDRLLREQMQFQIKELQREFGVTTVYVTHDQTEALTMSERIAVMQRGRIVEIGAPRDLYHAPRTRFAATFMGENNVLVGTLVEQNERAVFVRLTSGDMVDAPARARGERLGARVAVTVRPEDIKLTSASEERGPHAICGRVIDSVFRGSVVRYRIALGGSAELIVDSPGRDPVRAAGDEVEVSWPTDRCAVIDLDEVPAAAATGASGDHWRAEAANGQVPLASGGRSEEGK